MVWSCVLFIISGQTILQGRVKGGRRQGGQRKRWEDDIREWTGLEFAKSRRAVENREKLEEIGYEIICGAPTTIALKGQVKGESCIYMKPFYLIFYTYILCPISMYVIL